MTNPPHDSELTTARAIRETIAADLRWAARTSLRDPRLIVVALVVIGIGVLLGPTTPGPVVGAGWRLVVATVVCVLTLVLTQRLLSRKTTSGRLEAARLSGAIGVGLVTASFLLAWLLASIVPGGTDPAAQPVELAVALPVDIPVLIAATLLLLAVITSGFGDRLRVPGSLIFLALGMLFGDEGLAVVSLDNPVLVQEIGVAALVIVLFDGGLATTRQRLRDGLGAGLTLATLGVGLSAGITATGAMWILGVEPRLAWLIGAIVSSTDASAVFSLLRRIPAPDRVKAILQVESGMNDPIAILFTVGLLAAWTAPPAAGAWLTFGLTQLIGGGLVGLVVGVAGAALMNRIDLGATGLYPLLGLAVAGIAYGTAAAVGGSGFLATYVAGIVISLLSPRRRVVVQSFTDVLTDGIEIGLFLLLGLQVFPSDLISVAWTATAVALVLVLVARPVSVLLSLAWFRPNPQDVIAVSWLGLRGASPIVLATVAATTGIAEAALVFDVVFFVVLLSIVLQGTTAAWLMERLGMIADQRTTVVDLLPVERLAVELLDVTVPDDSPLVGHALSERPPPKSLLVVAVLRDEATLIPRGETVIHVGDHLVLSTNDPDRTDVAARAWVEGVATAGHNTDDK